MRLAEEGIAKLRESVDTLIVIPNQNLLEAVDKNTPCTDAFNMANDVLRQGVQGISDLIIETGLINIDFADAETIMRGQGDAVMSIGYGSGDKAVPDAIESAMKNPLLEDSSIKGSTRALIYVAGGKNFSLTDYNDVVEQITADISQEAIVIAGLYINQELEDKVRITVIATGFEHKRNKQVAQIPCIGGVKPGEVISDDEFQKIREKVPLGNWLPHRNNFGDDDLEIPTVIRDNRNSAI
jgi:cell division protein FtsZ